MDDRTLLLFFGNGELIIMYKYKTKQNWAHKITAILACLDRVQKKLLLSPEWRRQHLGLCLHPGLDVFGKTFLTLLHSGRPKLYTILAFLGVIGLKTHIPGGSNFMCNTSENFYRHLSFEQPGPGSLIYPIKLKPLMDVSTFKLGKLYMPFI